MFLTILHRETFGNLSNFTFLAAIAALTLLVPLTAFTQARSYKRLIADNALRKSIHRAESNTNSIVLSRSAPDLFPFYNGVYDSLPDEATVRNDSVSITPSSENLRPLDWLFPKIDLGVIVGILMTLMAVLLGHDAITSEREQGTLRLILSGPVPRSRLLAAKVGGLSLLMTLSLIYVMALYVCGIIVFSEGTVKLSLSLVIGIIFLFLFSFLVLVLFTTLGISISTLVKDSSMALVLSMGIWAFIVFIWPTIGSYVASSLHPVIGKQVSQREIVAQEARMIERELAAHKNEAAELSTARANAESAWQQHLELRRRWTELKKEEMGRLTASRKIRLREQQAAQRSLLLISPYGAFREVLAEICGTGIEDYNSFLAAAETFTWEEFIPASFANLAREKPWISSSETSQPLQMPVFESSTRLLTQRLRSVVKPLLILVFEAALLMGIGLFGFKSYDVR